MSGSNLRFGDGVTAEVGMDLKNMKARKVRGSCCVAPIMMYIDFVGARLGSSQIQ